MWREVIYWVSIVLCWFALGLNIWGFVRSQRMFKMYHEKYWELLRKEERGNK